ncbi:MULTISPECIES: aldo/keto reductase [Corynebacterium]|uniref:aldo/keto reductase n=1 Tax=Corynebacterium TaxID=1716 RepID=UPI002E322722|nr:aldo/keto reductase [Corynebacterium phoceense]
MDDDAVVEPVYHAIAHGYRHIDTAQAYGNEAGVGRSIARAKNFVSPPRSRARSKTTTPPSRRLPSP